MKVIVDDAIPFIDNRISEEVEVVRLPGKDINREVVKDADALIVRTRTKCNESLLKDSKVRLVATATIGTDHIDTKWCEANGIKVKSSPGCNAPGVAQYVLAALLESGFDIKSQTLGIIGYGNVGHVLVNWAKEMGIKTLISDAPREKAGFNDVNYLPLEEVLTQSDAVTLHVPLTTSGEYPTKYMIGERELNLMKHGAILINSSRGGVVKESDLKNKLNRGEVKAIIDVWENEPSIDPELVSLCHLATAHIAGYSEEGKRRATKMVLTALSEELGIEVNTRNLVEEPPVSMVSRFGNDVSGEGNLSKKLESEEMKKSIEFSGISPELILKSYSPSSDSLKLKSSVSSFEHLRNTYSYRHEPLYL